MDIEDSGLKYRISQMSDEDLLKMLENHETYRQEALDFAVKQLTSRNVSFEPPPQKPIFIVPKKKWGWRIAELLVGIAVVGFAVYLLRDLMNHPEEANFKTV